jgi:hypothetical protein
MLVCYVVGHDWFELVPCHRGPRSDARCDSTNQKSSRHRNHRETCSILDSAHGIVIAPKMNNTKVAAEDACRLELSDVEETWKDLAVAWRGTMRCVRVALRLLAECYGAYLVSDCRC